MANQGMALDSVFQALADPTRRAVVQRLSKGTATVSELAAPFDMALPSFVKHISVLERSRLIRSRKQGRVRTCSLERDNLAVAERWFDELRAQWASRYGNLDGLLAKLKGDEDGV
jgi:DNA-binding transcriptional ArsR family regulator